MWLCGCSLRHYVIVKTPVLRVASVAARPGSLDERMLFIALASAQRREDSVGDEGPLDEALSAVLWVRGGSVQWRHG